MGLMYYISKLKPDFIRWLVDVGLYYKYEEALERLARVRHLINMKRFLEATNYMSDLDIILSIVIEILAYKLIIHEKKSDEFSTIFENITETWKQLNKQYEQAMKTVLSKKLGFEQQFIGETYVSIYVTRMVNFIERLVLSIQDTQTLKRELALSNAVSKITIQPEESAEETAEELISEFTASLPSEDRIIEVPKDMEYSSQYLDAEEAAKIAKIIIKAGGCIDFSELAKKLKMTEKSLSEKLALLNYTIKRIGRTDSSLFIIQRDAKSIKVCIDMDCARDILFYIPENWNLHKVLKKLVQGK
jgi:hypothetical protein